MSAPKVAYFCMEFGLESDFKIYSGGLGILAGDILKAAKDINAPMVGVGILWRAGLTDQYIDKNGFPYDSYYDYRYDFLKDTGVTVEVKIKDDTVKLKVWKCDILGNVPLYLLDPFLPDNPHSLICGNLYGWFDEERIAQEIILGIGGYKALKALGEKVDIYHFNDSHPLFCATEIIKDYMTAQNMSFSEARAAARKNIVFTTHTPVPAGNEVHGHKVLDYMDAYNGLTKEQMTDIGGDPFGMTVAGLRTAKIANSVAELHCNTSNKMWTDVKDAAVITNITNGVHNKTWQSSQIKEAYLSNGDLYSIHQILKQKMIDEIYKRNGVKLLLDVPTIGFAKRAAPYKRGDLIFRDKAIIEPLLKEKKLQIIFAGKSHPNDYTGKNIIKNLFDMAKHYPESVVFLQNYDMHIGAMMTRGCDIWLNNPIRPLEACGTSGMKAAMNGVLNFAVLDGWWPEGCVHGVNGWQIGDGYEGAGCDEHDSKALYKCLTQEVLPTYQDKIKWAGMMRESIAMSDVKFSAQRMVKEYYEKIYSY